jgi:Domain of unknown function (DUF4159)
MVDRRHSRIGACMLVALPLALAGAAYGQLRQDSFDRLGALRGEQGDLAELPPAEWPDRSVAGCHMYYTSVRRESNGSGWRTDYPWAQRNLLMRLSELTKTRVSWQAPHVPHVYLVQLTDPALFECPYLMASDVGTIGLSDDEVNGLRQYLEKGGFLWVDDFWGEAAWDQWSRELARAMPAGEYAVENVPLSDPIFRATLEVRKVPQVAGIGFWRAYGGQTTSERGEESAEVHFRAIRSRQGRIVAVMTHNTDISNSWERETEDPAYFYQFSVEGYAVGINVLLYAMTH